MAGLYFAQARRYDAVAGRFVSEDKIKGFADAPFTMNPYIYCWNKPMELVDLNGLYPVAGVTAVVGAEMSGRLVESAPTAGISSVFGDTLEGEDTYTYDRDAAIEYAEKWSNSMTGWPSWIEAVLGKIGIGRNKDYYSYKTN